MTLILKCNFWLCGFPKDFLHFKLFCKRKGQITIMNKELQQTDLAEHINDVLHVLQLASKLNSRRTLRCITSDPYLIHTTFFTFSCGLCNSSFVVHQHNIWGPRSVLGFCVYEARQRKWWFFCCIHNTCITVEWWRGWGIGQRIEKKRRRRGTRTTHNSSRPTIRSLWTSEQRRDLNMHQVIIKDLLATEVEPSWALTTTSADGRACYLTACILINRLDNSLLCPHHLVSVPSWLFVPHSFQPTFDALHRATWTAMAPNWDGIFVDPGHRRIR